MTDTIFINDLRLNCLIGTFDYERLEKQRIILNIALSVNLKKAGNTDKLTDTVNYHDLYEQIIALVDTAQFELLESLAQAVATLCLREKKVKKVVVRIEKPQALPLARSSAIEITRNHDN